MLRALFQGILTLQSMLGSHLHVTEKNTVSTRLPETKYTVELMRLWYFITFNNTRQGRLTTRLNTSMFVAHIR